MGHRSARKRREVRDGNGTLVAVTCARCTLPIVIVCRACGAGTLDIDEHVKESQDCAKDVAYRTARATAPSLRVTKAALKLTGTLFPEEVLDPKGKTGAIHK